MDFGGVIFRSENFRSAAGAVPTVGPAWYLGEVVHSLWCFFFSSRRRHTRYWRDWSSDVCSSDLRYSRSLRMVASEHISCFGRLATSTNPSLANISRMAARRLELDILRISVGLYPGS